MPIYMDPKKTVNSAKGITNGLAKSSGVGIIAKDYLKSQFTAPVTQQTKTQTNPNVYKGPHPATNLLQNQRNYLLSGSGNSSSQSNNSDSASVANPVTSGGSGGTGSYSSSSSSSSNPYASYIDQLKALYAQQQANLNSYQQAQQQAAQNAYNNNMAALQSAYNAKISALDKNLADMKGQLASQYDYSKGNINADADKSLKEAYINKMLSQKNLQQQLSAQGISGGASESATAGLINNYGNARNEIDTTRGENLAGLEQTYNSNLADLMSNYIAAKQSAADQNLQYRMQLENALANNQTDSYSNLYNAMASLDANYLNAMQNALANQASFSAKQTSASNGVKNASTSGNVDLTSFNGAIDYAKKNIGPNNISDFVSQLAGNGYSDADIAYIIKKAGFPVSGSSGIDTSMGDAYAQYAANALNNARNRAAQYAANALNNARISK